MAKTKKSNMSDQLADLRGMRRKAHFANGGSLTEWRGGVAVRLPDKKKANSRKACRGRHTPDE